MPYTASQRKLFNAAAHDKKIAREHGMSSKEAKKLANEANKLAGEGKEKPSSKAKSPTQRFNNKGHKEGGSQKRGEAAVRDAINGLLSSVGLPGTSLNPTRVSLTQ